MNIRIKYILPFILGFIGMIICHVGLFLCWQAGIKFMVYIIVYPVVYSIMTIILTIRNYKLWFTNALYICLIPFLYWYYLLFTEDKLNVYSANIYNYSEMSIIILFTFGLSVLVSFIAKKTK